MKYSDSERNSLRASGGFLDQVTQRMFGRSRSSCIENGVCVACGGDAKSFKDTLSMQDFSVTGICQDCQDKLPMEIQE